MVKVVSAQPKASSSQTNESTQLNESAESTEPVDPEPGQKFLTFAQTTFPKLNRIVKIDANGYPIEGMTFNEIWGWCLDPTGRVVVVTPEHYLFQRFNNEYGLMISTRDRSGWMPAGKHQLLLLQVLWSFP